MKSTNFSIIPFTRKPLLIFFSLIFCGSFLCDCTKPCIESRGIEGAGLTITFFNTEANEYFYPEQTSLSPFSIDSLIVKDSKGNILKTPYQIGSEVGNGLKKFLEVDIYPIYIPSQDETAFSAEQTKYIYIQYNYNTYDTIKLVYKAKAEKCANSYEYLKAYYHNNLIADTYNSYFQGLNFQLNSKS